MTKFTLPIRRVRWGGFPFWVSRLSIKPQYLVQLWHRDRPTDRWNRTLGPDTDHTYTDAEHVMQAELRVHRKRRNSPAVRAEQPTCLPPSLSRVRILLRPATTTNAAKTRWGRERDTHTAGPWTGINLLDNMGNTKTPPQKKSILEGLEKKNLITYERK